MLTEWVQRRCSSDRPWPIPQGNKIMPYIILEDDAFRIKTFLMKPYIHRNLLRKDRTSPETLLFYPTVMQQLNYQSSFSSVFIIIVICSDAVSNCHSALLDDKNQLCETFGSCHRYCICSITKELTGYSVLTIKVPS